jgi:cytochrome P450
MTLAAAVHNGRPPGPSIAALAAVFTASRGNPYTFLPEIARRHGDVVNIPVPMLGWTLTLLAHPDHVEHVMTRHHQRYGRHYLVREMVVGEPGVIPPMEGDQWRRWRGALNPFFGPASLANVSGTMAPAVAAGVDAWGARTGRWLDLEHELGAVVMDALMRSMFSTTLDPDTLHRYVQAARDEVDALGGHLVEYQDLDRLPYLRACLDEGLRLQAPPGMLRTAVEDDEIGGYLIPERSHVLVCPYGLHQDPRFWTAPKRFDPDRFLTGTVNRNAFIPFNTGPRKCLGYRLAYIDGVMTLATILARYTLETRPGWTPKPKMRISTGLAGGLPVRLSTR